jgi:uncharacterized protein (TIGR02594 family)
MEPIWYTEAKKYVGLKEIPGSKHNPTIIGWAKRLGSKILGITVNDDETPWCGTFVAHCMTTANMKTPPIAVRAKSWAGWGRKLIAPRLGCVLVFTREGGGHVGFYVGEDATAYHVLGGNQSNSVSVTRIAKDRLTENGMRWPFEAALPEAKVIRRSAGNLSLSKNEA